MPYRCCVPGCKGNAKDGPKVHCFSFPSDQNLYKKWLAAIPRLNFVPYKTSRVCHLHFAEKYIRRTMSQKDSKTGNTFTWDLGRLRLLPDAVPTIFSDSGPSVVKNEEEELLEIKEEVTDTVVVKTEPELCFYNESRQFQNYTQFLTAFSIFETPENWFIHNEQQRVIIFKLQYNPGPSTSYSVVINSDLKLETYLYGQEIAVTLKTSKTPFIVNNLDQISELLDVIDNGTTDGSDDDNNGLKCILNHVTTVLSDVKRDEDDRIAMISEQLKLHSCFKLKYRYSPKIMIFSSIIFTINPQMYQLIRHSSFLILPHPQTIRAVCRKYPTDPESDQKHLIPKYIRTTLKHLSGNEKQVILLINEIDVKPYLGYKKGNSTMLTTVYAFMIHSVYSDLKEVVQILPTSKISQEDLYNTIKSIISILEEIGYKVFCVVANNSPTSTKAMSHFAINKKLSIVYPHPLDNGRPLFFLYDPVHLLKCVKRDWMNAISEQTLIYPDFDTGTEKCASFKVLKKLHTLEQNLVKFDCPLNMKDLFSTNLEIQDVHLAQKIFNSHVLQALPQIEGSKDTSDFINIILRWWNIANDNADVKGSDLVLEPIIATDPTSPKLEFLEKMLTWLDVWKERNISDRLALETHTALYHTIHGLIEITRYCFEELKLDYVLLGKFQTDSLEHRFGTYRHITSNQYLSIRQVYESEKKLVIQSLPVLKSPAYGHIRLEKFHEYIDVSDGNVPSTLLNLTVDITEANFAEIEDEVPALTYLAGYCCHVVLKTELQWCRFCRERLVYPEVIVVEEPFDLVKNETKEKLLFPHDVVVQVVLCVFVMFNYLLGHFEEDVFSSESGNVRHVISQLVMKYVAEVGYLHHFQGCDQHSEERVAKIIINWVTNTLLKNYYGKNQSEKISKKRKLSS